MKTQTHKIKNGVSSFLFCILTSVFCVLPFSGCGGGGGNKNPVTPPTLNSIVIFVDTPTQLKAFGYYSDGATKDITTSVLWTSSDILVATVDASGKIIPGSKTGATYITAFIGDLQSEGFPYTTSSGTVSPPSAPTGVTATAGDGTATISWSTVSGATSYNLYMASQTGVTKSNYITLADGMAHTGVTPPFVHAGLTNGKTYYFVVTAANAGGESAESQQVSAMPIKPVTKMSAGSAFTCAVLTGGSVKCWGSNVEGQLGNGTNTGPETCTAPPASGSLACSTTPVSASNLISVTDIAAGPEHVCSLHSDGTIMCWGRNRSGGLGNGTTTDSFTPVSVNGISGAIGVTAGSDALGSRGNSCALISGGSIRCWGKNDGGQLGNGTTTDSLVPVTVSGINTAISVKAGNTSTCALLSNGTIKCWGYNGLGQLGDGTNTDSTLPVTVTGINNAIGLDVGGYHACALLSDSTVKCWGGNLLGQLGNGTTTSSSIPVPVSGISSVTSLTTGGEHTCVTLSDKSVKCWGQNMRGQLGNGTITTYISTPVSVLGMSNAVRVEGGVDHTCALLTEGTIKCWGSNVVGDLGNGTNTGPDNCQLTLGGVIPGLYCNATPASVSNSLYAFFSFLQRQLLAYTETLDTWLQS